MPSAGSDSGADATSVGGTTVGRGGVAAGAAVPALGRDGADTISVSGVKVGRGGVAAGAAVPAVVRDGVDATSVGGTTAGRGGVAAGAAVPALGRDGAAAGGGTDAGRSAVSGFTGTLGVKPFGCWNMRDSPLQSATQPHALSQKFRIAQLSQYERSRQHWICSHACEHVHCKATRRRAP